MSGRARPPVSTRAPLATASSMWREHLAPSAPALTRLPMSAPQCSPVDRRIRATRSTNRRHELVVDVGVHDEPLGADAELAGRGEAGAHGARRRPGAGRRRRRRTWCSCRRARGRRRRAACRRACGDPAAGGGRAGEADVVGAGRRRPARSGSPWPSTTCSRSLGQPGLARSSSAAAQRGQRALQVGAQHDGVAGQQRRDGVGDRQAQRVVPRRDDADDALGAVVLDRAGEHGQHADVLGLGAAATGRGGRSAAPRSRSRRPPRTRATRALPDSSCTRSSSSACRSSTRSCTRSSTAARSSTGVAAQRALGARGRASTATSTSRARGQRQRPPAAPRSSGCGCSSSPPSPAATTRAVSARTRAGSTAYVACGIGLGVGDDFGHYRRVTTPPVSRRSVREERHAAGVARPWSAALVRARRRPRPAGTP